MYKIKISYRTGDSFHTEDTEDYLEGTWKNIEILTENMKRIKTHYEWYKEVNEHSWSKPKNTKIKVPECVRLSEYSDSFGSVLLLTDDKVEYPVSPFWCGYFETLYSASVEMDMKVEF